MPNTVPLAFCITDLDPGGAERALVQLVSRLDRDEWDSVVYCLAGRGALADELDARDIRVVCLGARSWRDLGVLRQLQRLLSQQRPALLQTFLFHANFIGRIAARRAGVPCVVAGIRVSERQRRSHQWLDRITRKLVAHHVCVSQEVANFSIRRAKLDPDRVSVISNGVDFERYAQAVPADLTPWGIPPGAPVLLFVGRLHEQKGLSVLLEATSQLMAERDDAHLLIVGHGRLEGRMQSRIAANDLSTRMHLLGFRDDVPELMQAASALVLPSLWEGQPNVVLEAMAAGLPVVASNVDGITDLVTPGTTGWLVEPGSAEALLQALRDVLASGPEGRRRLGFESQLHIRTKFTWEKSALEYAALYRRLLTGSAWK